MAAFALCVCIQHAHRPVNHACVGRGDSSFLVAQCRMFFGGLYFGSLCLSGGYPQNEHEWGQQRPASWRRFSLLLKQDGNGGPFLRPFDLRTETAERPFDLKERQQRGPLTSKRDSKEALWPQRETAERPFDLRTDRQQRGPLTSKGDRERFV